MMASMAPGLPFAIAGQLAYPDRQSVAIVGDVLHSRVARSLIHGLTTLGTPDVRVVGPRTLLPTSLRISMRGNPLQSGLEVYQLFLHVKVR